MLPNEKLTETLAEQNKLAPTTMSVKKLFNFRREARKNFNQETAIIIKYVYPLTILIIIAVLFLVFYFLYQNFYLTMTEAAAVNNLKINVLSTEINQTTFDQVIKRGNTKLSLTYWANSGNLKSPFNYGARNNYSATTTANPIITSTTTKATATTTVKTTTTATIITATSTTSTTVATTTKK